MIMLLSLLTAFSCEDKDDSFSIVGKWQKASKVENTGAWQSAGDRYDLKEGGSGVYYDEGNLENPKSISYTFDELTMLLVITRLYGKNEVIEYSIKIETNDIIFWNNQPMKRIIGSKPANLNKTPLTQLKSPLLYTEGTL